jgi:hypothetical protein
MTHAEHGWRDGEPETGGRDESTRPDESTERYETPGLDGSTGPHGSTGSDGSTGADKRGRPVRPASEADLMLDNDPLLEVVAGEGEPDASQKPSADRDHRAELVETGDRERFTARWQEIQAGFVDEPKRAVHDADSLVADLMQRLAQAIAAERERLDSHPGSGEDVPTEELRQALRRYRSLFERLLAA